MVFQSWEPTSGEARSILLEFETKHGKVAYGKKLGMLYRVNTKTILGNVDLPMYVARE